MRRLIPNTQRRNARPQESRDGAAMVEFAIISPVFLALVLGVVEIGTALEASNLMTSALREGGRLATMDWETVVPQNLTPNEKVETDIRNFLQAAGFPASEVHLTIRHAEGANEGQPFDLADPDNKLQLFTISASIPYDSVSSYPSNFLSGQTLKASITMRAGKIKLLQ